MSTITKPGAYQIAAEQYHADPCPSPSLSSSIVKVLLDESPGHAWTAHPRLNPDFKPKDQTNWDLGSAAHDILLEGEARIMSVKFKDYKTNDAKAQRDLARSRGQIPVLAASSEEGEPSQLDRVRAFVANVRRQLDLHEDSAMAFTAGTPELTLVWQDSSAGVWCRARLDWVMTDWRSGLPWFDFKSTETSVHPDVIGAYAMKMGWDIQSAFYRRGIRQVLGVRDPHFKFVVAENTPPYAIGVVDLPPEIERDADQKVEYAIRLWQSCLATNTWPTYPRRTITAHPPGWATKRWEEQRERAKTEWGAKIDPVLNAMLNEPL